MFRFSNHPPRPDVRPNKPTLMSSTGSRPGCLASVSRGDLNPRLQSPARAPKRRRSMSRQRSRPRWANVSARSKRPLSGCVSTWAERRRNRIRSLLASSGSLAPCGTSTSILPRALVKERMLIRGWTKAAASVHGATQSPVAVVTRHPCDCECTTATTAPRPRRNAWRAIPRPALKISASVAMDALQGYPGKASAPASAPACTAASAAATERDGRSATRSPAPDDSDIPAP